MTEEQQRIHDLIEHYRKMDGQPYFAGPDVLFNFNSWLSGLRESTKEPVQLPMIGVQ